MHGDEECIDDDVAQREPDPVPCRLCMAPIWPGMELCVGCSKAHADGADSRQAEVDELKRARDGWEADALLRAQNTARAEAMLAIAVEALRSRPQPQRSLPHPETRRVIERWDWIARELHHWYATADDALAQIEALKGGHIAKADGGGNG